MQLKATDLLLNWVEIQKFGLLDVNAMARTPIRPVSPSFTRPYRSTATLSAFGAADDSDTRGETGSSACTESLEYSDLVSSFLCLAVHFLLSATEHSKSHAKKIVFIGQSVGCAALTELINCKFDQVRQRVKAAVMVLGLQKPPPLMDPLLSPELRNWYAKV